MRFLQFVEKVCPKADFFRKLSNHSGFFFKSPLSPKRTFQGEAEFVEWMSRFLYPFQAKRSSAKR